MADPTARLEQRIKAAINDDSAAKELIALLKGGGIGETSGAIGSSQTIVGTSSILVSPDNTLDENENLLAGATGATEFTVPADGDYIVEPEALIQITVVS